MNIEGMDKLLAKLDALGGNVDEALNKGLMQGAKMVQAAAKNLCPVDDGRLRNSITVTDEEAKEYRYGSSGGEKGVGRKFYTGKLSGGGNRRVVVGTNVEYAAYVEFGTGKKGESTNTNTEVKGLSYKQDKWLVNIPDVGPRYTDGQEAKPFLYPALKNNEEAIKTRVRNVLKKAINEVAKK